MGARADESSTGHLDTLPDSCLSTITQFGDTVHELQVSFTFCIPSRRINFEYFEFHASQYEKNVSRGDTFESLGASSSLLAYDFT